MRARSRQRGVTLIELVLAIAIGAILLAGINNLLKLGLDAGASVRNSNELAYQGSFALERIADKARATAPPKTLAAPAANTSGDWFAPVMYCRNASNQLIETTTADAACSGTTVLAGNVTFFSASAVIGPGTRPVAVLSLTMSNAGSTQTLSSSMRLGGGLL